MIRRLALLAVLLGCSGCPAIFFDPKVSEALVPSRPADAAGNATYVVTVDGLEERHRHYVESPLRAALAESARYQNVGRSDLVPRELAPEDVHLEITTTMTDSTPPLLPTLTVLTLGIVPSWSDAHFESTLRVVSARGESPEYRSSEDLRIAMGLVFLPWFFADVAAMADGEQDAYIGGVFLSLYRSLLAQARADDWMR